MPWEREKIENDQLLYMRVHRNVLKDGQLVPGVFRDQGSSMSTNWVRYCPTAEDCRQKAKSPPDNGVVQAHAGPIRDIDTLLVEHTPVEAVDRQDRSHTCVIGEKTTEVRLDLYDIFSWALYPEAQT